MAEPRATESIAGIIEIIARLDAQGHAYTIEGTTYFSVTTFPEFGKLSHYSRAQMIDFARERGGHPDDARQRDPLDFILWQPSLPDEPSWESLWGPGRPGWHIECSALSMRELATTTLDLHGGGEDLIFPHHECEAAQSEAATGQPLARHWMHQSYVKLDGVKMSKSLGNLRYVSDLTAEGYDPTAIRLIIVAHHYRDGWEWFDHLLPTGAARLATWREAGEGDGALDEVRACLDDDLDTPGAVAAIDAAAARGEGVSTAALLLGVVL